MHMFICGVLYTSICYAWQRRGPSINLWFSLTISLCRCSLVSMGFSMIAATRLSPFNQPYVHAAETVVQLFFFYLRPSYVGMGHDCLQACVCDPAGWPFVLERGPQPGIFGVFPNQVWCLSLVRLH